MKKKGFMTLEHFIMLVVAVICIILIFVVIGKLTDQKKETERDVAERNLVYIAEAVAKAKENGVANAILFNPKGWWVIAWPYKERNEKPDICEPNCVCLCPVGTASEGLDIGELKGAYINSLEECNDNGVCINIDEPIKTTNEDSGGLLFDWLLPDAKPLRIVNPPYRVYVEYDKDKGYEVIRKEADR